MTTRTTFDIRKITPEENARSRIADYAFRPSPAAPKPEDQRFLSYVTDARIFASFQDDAPVAKIATFPMTINVRGSVMSMGGLSGVSTMPAGRRQGHIRALLNTAFEQMRDDGQAVSTLYPFRESFYERMGYTGWPAPLWVTVNPADLFPIVRLDKPGTAEQMLIADGFDEWMSFLARYQKDTHGFSLTGSTFRERIRNENEFWLVFAREDDEVTGAMTYRITGYGKSMIVSTFYARTMAAEYQLLDWIGRHTDQVKEARICLARDAEPELWYRDVKPTVSSSDEEAWDAPMGRVVSIEGLAGIGTGGGAVTLEVTDEQCPWNQGTWTLRGGNGSLEVSQGGNATATIAIQALSALVFTGINPEFFPFRGWGNVDDETAAQLRSMFPHASPYLHEQF